MPSLFVIQGRDQGTRFRLDGNTVTFGRGTSNAVQLHDTEISREHAEFSRRGYLYFLRDLGSSNGTFVNGKQIKEHELASGDQLQLGRTLLLYTGVTEGRVRRPRRQNQIRIATRRQRRLAASCTPMRQSEGSELARAARQRNVVPLAGLGPAAICKSCIAPPWR